MRSPPPPTPLGSEPPWSDGSHTGSSYEGSRSAGSPIYSGDTPFGESGARRERENVEQAAHTSARRRPARSSADLAFGAPEQVLRVVAPARLIDRDRLGDLADVARRITVQHDEVRQLA